MAYRIVSQLPDGPHEFELESAALVEVSAPIVAEVGYVDSFEVYEGDELVAEGGPGRFRWLAGGERHE